MCLKESYLINFWKLASVAPESRRLGLKSLWLKTATLLSLLSVVSKIFEKLIYNGHVVYVSGLLLISNMDLGPPNIWVVMADKIIWF